MPKGKTKKRYALAEAQNWRCCYCGGRMHEDGMRPDGVTIEHVVTRAEGGSSGNANLVAACLGCNQARAGYCKAEKFYKLRRNRLRKGLWPPCTAPRKPVRRWMAVILAEAELNRLAEDWRARTELALAA